MQPGKKQKGSRQFSRRHFLYTLGISVAAGALSACAPPRSSARPASIEPFPPHPILPSPQPAHTATPLPATEGLPLADFLALSALLTGVDDLNPQVGTVYLQSLQASEQFDVTLAELYEQAGLRTATPPSTVEELAAGGLFAREATRQLADKIIEYWYTGIYDTPDGEQAVATFVDALAWRTLTFTKPLTICGAPNFWAEPPDHLRG